MGASKKEKRVKFKKMTIKRDGGEKGVDREVYVPHTGTQKQK